jgi:hypothetical protein
METGASPAPDPNAAQRSHDAYSTSGSNNEAERGSRPVKVQQRTSGGCWHPPQGLADFAVIQSYLSTAAKWGIDAPTHSSSSSKAPGYQPRSGPAE